MSNDGKLDIAVNCLNPTNERMTLRRIRNLTNWLEYDSEYSIETVGERLGEINGVGEVESKLNELVFSDDNQLIACLSSCQDEALMVLFIPLQNSHPLRS